MKLTLLFRQYCGLCHQMRQALLPYQEQYRFNVEIIEIDDFPEWEQQYDEWVPVLLHEQEEICHWHFDEEKFTQFLHAHRHLLDTPSSLSDVAENTNF